MCADQKLHLTRKMHNPGETYIDAAMKLAQYLAVTVEVSLIVDQQ